MIGNTFIFIASFVLVLGLVVFFHELGHYGVAKLFGTRIERFSVGFGKPVARWTSKRTGEEWVVGRLPLGGYVKFAGDMGAASVADREKLAVLKEELGEAEAGRLFALKPLWQRAAVVAAGPMANFVLSALIFAAIAWTFGVSDARPVVGEVSPDSAAEAAGLQPGDVITSIDGRDIDVWADIGNVVALRADTPITVEYERSGRPASVELTPVRVVEEDGIGGRMERGLMGVSLAESERARVANPGPVEALAHGTAQVGNGIRMTGSYIGRIFTGKESGQALGGVGRIGAMTGKVGVDTWAANEKLGDKFKGMFWSLLSLMAALSLGLGIANLMPIPMLDGGHLAFYGYEAVAGRPLSERAQDMGFRVGVAVLLGLFVLLTINDVGYIRSLLS